MLGVIEQTKPSTSGKTLGVLIAGQWYSTKHFELASCVGQQINFQTSSREYDGSVIHWLNDYSDSAATPAAQAMNAAMAQAPTATGPIPPTPPAAVYEQQPQAPLQIQIQIDRQASIIAQALTKSCTAPGDDVQKVWSRYCSFYRFALKGVPDSEPVQAPVQTTQGFQPAPDGFDDSIPF